MIFEYFNVKDQFLKLKGVNKLEIAEALIENLLKEDDRVFFFLNDKFMKKMKELDLISAFPVEHLLSVIEKSYLGFDEAQSVNLKTIIVYSYILKHQIGSEKEDIGIESIGKMLYYSIWLIKDS